MLYVKEDALFMSRTGIQEGVVETVRPSKCVSHAMQSLTGDRQCVFKVVCRCIHHLLRASRVVCGLIDRLEDSGVSVIHAPGFLLRWSTDPIIYWAELSQLRYMHTLMCYSKVWKG